MKRTTFLCIITCTLLLFSGQKATAQEVYKMVMQNAQHAVEMPTSSFAQTQIAQFKITALNYMKQKAFDTMPKVTTNFLNTKAYYLSEFITLFFNELMKVKGLKEDKQKRCRMLFVKAANAHPQFKIVEEATAEDSISTGENLIPFPLNTDWEKAYEEVQEKLKSKSAK